MNLSINFSHHFKIVNRFPTKHLYSSVFTSKYMTKITHIGNVWKTGNTKVVSLPASELKKLNVGIGSRVLIEVTILDNIQDRQADAQDGLKAKKLKNATEIKGTIPPTFSSRIEPVQKTIVSGYGSEDNRHSESMNNDPNFLYIDLDSEKCFLIDDEIDDWRKNVN